jgi:hypothetical protein
MLVCKASDGSLREEEDESVRHVSIEVHRPSPNGDGLKRSLPQAS